MAYKKALSKDEKRKHKLFRDIRKKGGRGKQWQVTKE